MAQQINLIDLDDLTDLSKLPVQAGFEIDQPFERKLEHTIRHVKGLLRSGTAIAASTSGGKDSACMVAVVLEAARQLVEAGEPCADIRFMSSRTKLDNPEVDQHLLKDHQELTAFIEKHNLPAKALMTEPSYTEDYLVQILAGRIIPSTPMTNHKCAVMMKVGPLERLRSKVFNDELAAYAWENVIVTTGKRMTESKHRELEMRKNGEVPWEAKEINGRLMLPPIAHWTIDDVWTFIGQVTNGRFKTYSDFHRLMEVYRAGNGGLCGVLVHEGK